MRPASRSSPKRRKRSRPSPPPRRPSRSACFQQAMQGPPSGAGRTLRQMVFAPGRVIYLSTMPTVDNPTEKTLADLGADSAEKVGLLFAEVRSRFDEQTSRPLDSSAGETLKQSWTGRKSGVLTLIGDNWLKPAGPELKR